MNIVALIGCRVEMKMKKIQEELIQQYRKSSTKNAICVWIVQKIYNYTDFSFLKIHNIFFFLLIKNVFILAPTH